MTQTTVTKTKADPFADPIPLDDVAKLFRVTPRTAEGWAKDGLLDSTGKGQGRVFSRPQIDALLRGE